MTRPVHTGVHSYPQVEGDRYCEVCGLAEALVAGRFVCSGLRGVIGRETSEDLTGRGVAIEPGASDAHVRDEQVPQPAPRPVRKPSKRRGISPATPDQRLKARGGACAACGLTSVEITIDPAHLIPRGMTTVGQDDPRAVVPLCRRCHRVYDDECLDLSSSLEPNYRDEVAFAVARVGLFAALRRITNSTWAPVERAA